MKKIFLDYNFYNCCFGDNETEKYHFNKADLIPSSNGEKINHTYYQLAYSEPNEQAEWVFFKLTPELVN